MRISYGIDVFQRVEIETAHLILHRKQYDVEINNQAIRSVYNRIRICREIKSDRITK